MSFISKKQAIRLKPCESSRPVLVIKESNCFMIKRNCPSRRVCRPGITLPARQDLKTRMGVLVRCKQNCLQTDRIYEKNLNFIIRKDVAGTQNSARTFLMEWDAGISEGWEVQ